MVTTPPHPALPPSDDAAAASNDALFPADPAPAGAPLFALFPQLAQLPSLDQFDRLLAAWKAPDLPALRAQWRAQAAMAGDLGARVFEAWRQLAQANLHFLRQDSEAGLYLWRQLLQAGDPLDAATMVARQLRPASERLRVWETQLLDALGGMQADVTVLAETCLPAARESAVAVVDELVRLPAGAPLRPWLH